MRPRSRKRRYTSGACPGRYRSTTTKSMPPTLLDPRPALQEQLPQDRAVAARLVRAIAADGEARRPRERRQEVERAARLGLPHLGAEAAHEGLPRRRGIRALGLLEQRGRRGEVREPHVV